MMTISIRTIGDCLDYDYYVTVHCGCVGAQAPDLAVIAARYGRHVPIDALRGRLRCRKCHCMGDELQLASGAASRVTGDYR